MFLGLKSKTPRVLITVEKTLAKSKVRFFRYIPSLYVILVVFYTPLVIN